MLHNKEGNVLVIKLIRILGVRSKSPGVVGIVDGQQVKWNDGKDYEDGDAF